jgi:hypothetical protein
VRRKKKKSVIHAFLFLIWSQTTSADELLKSETLNIEGELRERGTRTPLSSVNVYWISDEKKIRIKTTTDTTGHFIIENLPPGQFHWVINQSGYERYDREDQQELNGKNRKRTLYLEKTSYQIYETTITGKQEKRDDTTKSLTAAQFSKLPGSGGDPIRAVQNLPGVNRAAPFQAQVIIQGSAPQDTRYMINGHEVPIIFHFGGLSSVVIPESLERVDYLAAGYGPEFGRAIGGLVGVQTRPALKDRIHGFGFVDIFNAGALLEGPVGEKSTFLIGARKSYIGNVLGVVAKGNKDFNLTVAPTFGDLTGIYETEISPRDHLRLVSVGSQDELKFVLNQPVGQSASLRGDFYNQTAFFRVIPELTHKHSEITYSRWSFGFGRDWNRFDLGSNYTRISTYTLSFRNELERKMNESWKSYWGIDSRFVWARADFSIPGSLTQAMSGATTTESDRQTATVLRNSNQLGFYWRNLIHQVDSPWTFLPSGRVDYFNLTQQWIPQPRLATRYAWNESLTLRAAGGLYAQPPQEAQVASGIGNPNLKSPRAWQLSMGADKDFRQNTSRGLSISTEGFYRYFDQLVVPSTGVVTQDGNLVPEVYNNSGRGRAYGLQNLIRMDLKPWTGWISYTLSRSTRFDSSHPEYVFQYDQTHLLTALTSIDLKGNWTLSARFRYATGNPYTPIATAVFDSDGDKFIPIQGAFYSQRVSAFMQFDLRIDKKWIYNNWILSAYLDIQNLTNRANIQSVQYAYDYQSSTQISGLPILPTFGVKGEF